MTRRVPRARLQASAFISGTQKDLQTERRVAHRSLARAGFVVMRAETAPSGGDSPRHRTLELVRTADLFVGIYSRTRYGEVPQGSSVSASEMEFNEARRLGKPMIAYVRALRADETVDRQQEEFLRRAFDFNSGLFRRPAFASTRQLGAWIRRDAADEVQRSAMDSHVSEDLPLPVAYFENREAELARMRRWLRSDRSTLAVVGMAGSGKTQLALRFARGVRPGSRSRIWLDLGDSDLDAVLVDLATTLNVRAEAISIDDVRRRTAFVRSKLASGRALLIGDDARSTSVVVALAESLGPSKLIITTRDRELAEAIDADTIDADLGHEPMALRILASRAGAPAVDAEPASARRICEMTGFLPLAISILGARARASSLTLRAIEKDLSKHRIDAVRLGIAPSPHTDLAAAIRISFNRLDSATLDVARAVAQVEGPDFGRDLIAAMVDIAPDEAEQRLGSLVALSLLQRGRTDRWRVHPAVGLFLRSQRQRRHHARLIQYYRKLAYDFGATRQSRREAHMMRVIDSESRTLDRALQLARRRDPVAYAEMTEALWWYWSHRGALRIARRWLRQVKLDKIGPELRVRVLVALGYTEADRGLFQLAHDHFYDAVEVARAQATPTVAYALTALAYGLWGLGRYRESARKAEEARILAAQVGDVRTTARALNVAGLSASYSRNFSRAADYFEESLAQRRQQGDSWGIANSLSNLGEVQRCLGNIRTARILYQRSRRVRQSIGDNWGLANVYCNIGDLDIESGRRGAAINRYHDALSLAWRSGNSVAIATALSGYSRLFLMGGNRNEAALLLVRCEELLAASGTRLGPAHELGIGPARRALRSAVAQAESVGARTPTAAIVRNLTLGGVNVA